MKVFLEALCKSIKKDNLKDSPCHELTGVFCFGENKMKRKLLFLICLLILAVPILAAHRWTWQTGVESDLLDQWINDPLFPGDVSITGNLVLKNGATLDNATNNAFEWNENDEELIWTFGSDSVTMSTGTSVVFSFGTMIPNLDGLDVDSYVYFNPTTAPATTEGYTYYDSSAHCLKYRNNSAWVSLTAGTGDNTLDNAYDQGGNGAGAKIDADTGPVEIEVDDNSTGNGGNYNGLHIDYDDATNDGTPLIIESAVDAADSPAIDIDAQTTGRDIEGTGASFYVEGDGSIVGIDLDVTGSGGITLQNDETILNDTDSEIELSNGAEDVSFNLATNNTVTLTTDTSVDSWAFGVVDDLEGVGTITFDAAASTITLPADGAADNLTIQVTGAQDSHLILTSAGTSADAYRVNASAGGIDIDADDGIAIDAAGTTGEDIVITNSGGSIKLEATEAATDAIVIDASNAAGGMDIDSGTNGIDIDCTGGAVAIDNDGAGKDITLTSDAGSVYLQADQASVTDAIKLTATNGGISMTSTAEASVWTHTATGAADDLTISVAGNQNASLILQSAGSGTDALTLSTVTNAGDIVMSSNDKIDVDSAGTSAWNVAGDTMLFQIDTDGAADDLTLKLDGDDDCSIVLDSDGTGADTISIQAPAGGFDFDAGTDTIHIQNAADGDADDITIAMTGANASSIILDNTQSTASDAISLQASGTGGGVDVDTDDGAISIVADGSANGDITIDAQDQITIVSTDSDGTGTIYIHANGGTSEDIKIHADQGTAADSIDVMSDVGGVTITASGGNGAGVLKLISAVIFDGSMTAFGAADGTPDVSGHTFFTTGGADTYTDFDAGTGSLVTGQLVIVKSAHAAVFDTTGTGLKGSSVDITTASGDITWWIYDGTDWILSQFTDVSADNSGGV